MVMRRLNKKYWPYMLNTKMLDGTTGQALEWCKKTLPGELGETLAGPNQWYFKKEKDVTMFTLRWSS
jgi:hypothetical protein